MQPNLPSQIKTKQSSLLKDVGALVVDDSTSYSENDVICLPGVSPTIIQHLVNFIYDTNFSLTGVDQDDLGHLLNLAKKYKIQDLVHIVEQLLHLPLLVGGLVQLVADVRLGKLYIHVLREIHIMIIN